MAKYCQKILHFFCYTCKAYELKNQLALPEPEAAVHRATRS